MVGNVTTYGAGRIARGGFGPAGTGHPPPDDPGAPPVTAPTFELISKGIETAHAAADRIEAALDRIEPAEAVPSEGEAGQPPTGHAQYALGAVRHLFSRLHRLADRLDNHA